MKRVQDQAPLRTDEESDWISKNLAQQEERHVNIVKEMEALAPQRDVWIDEFFQRLQARGYNYNCDAVRVIDKDDIPKKPNRRFKVVF